MRDAGARLPRPAGQSDAPGGEHGQGELAAGGPAPGRPPHNQRQGQAPAPHAQQVLACNTLFVLQFRKIYRFSIKIYRTCVVLYCRRGCCRFVLGWCKTSGTICPLSAV